MVSVKIFTHIVTVLIRNSRWTVEHNKRSNLKTMKTLKNKNQCLISYRVELDKNCQWYNQIMESTENPFPIECLNESPIIARAKAFDIVDGNVVQNLLYKPSDFRIFLVDKSTGMDYLICTGEEPTPEVMPNLELELQLYDNYGFESAGWTRLSDGKGKEYRVIEDTFMLLYSESYLPVEVSPS